MRAYLLLVGALAACGTGRGKVHAEWQVAGEEKEFSTEGEGAWCASSGRAFVAGLEGDRAVGVHWHFDSLVPATFELEPPTSPDSTVTGASAAARYVYLDEVRGYRSLSGQLAVTKIDSATVSGRLNAIMQQLGQPDSMTLTMTFDRIALVADTTLCVAPKPATDSLATDTLAPSTAPAP